MFAQNTNFVRPRVPQLHLVHPSFRPERLVGRHGVGDVNVSPRYLSVGSVGVEPHYVGYPGEGYSDVGAPVQAVPSLNRQPTQYAPTEYYSSDVTYLGTGLITVPANQTITTPKILPDRPFKPQNFKFASNVQNLDLISITIAGTNILNNQLGFPVELLSEVSTFNQIDWPTLDPAIGFTMTIRNNTASPLVLRGGMYGTQVRQ